MMDLIKDFLAQIDRYCGSLGISDSTYGERAMNDRSFVHQVRAGSRTPSLKTIAKNNRYMAENPAPVIPADAAGDASHQMKEAS